MGKWAEIEHLRLMIGTRNAAPLTVVARFGSGERAPSHLARVVALGPGAHVGVGSMPLGLWGLPSRCLGGPAALPAARRTGIHAYVAANPVSADLAQVVTGSPDPSVL